VVAELVVVVVVMVIAVSLLVVVVVVVELRSVVIADGSRSGACLFVCLCACSSVTHSLTCLALVSSAIVAAGVFARSDTCCHPLSLPLFCNPLSCNPLVCRLATMKRWQRS
jgi:hypothetical protein